ncbi:hypothetical protein AVEN_251954-1 [Araneus ventricosus]|uniref:Uncharacterized protein n=1 Tax=Araneus ventricosus TaxID=182803 RepID=A0A4Y2TTP4_ARAVE|nr:hypothetical protein AVEN_251954-1 [Araneus ventricosus]
MEPTLWLVRLSRQLKESKDFHPRRDGLLFFSASTLPTSNLIILRTHVDPTLWLARLADSKESCKDFHPRRDGLLFFSASTLPTSNLSSSTRTWNRHCG